MISNSYKHPNGDETTELCDPAIRTASLVQGKLAQLLCVSQAAESDLCGAKRGKKKKKDNCKAFKYFCSTKVSLSYTDLFILSIQVQISLFTQGYRSWHK